MDIFSGIPFMAGYLAAWCRVVDDFDWPIWHRAVGVPEGQRPVPTVRPLGRTFGPRFVGGFGSWGVAPGCRGAAPVALKIGRFGTAPLALAFQRGNAPALR
jgi:hypothetical protein